MQAIKVLASWNIAKAFGYSKLKYYKGFRLQVDARNALALTFCSSKITIVIMSFKKNTFLYSLPSTVSRAHRNIVNPHLECCSIRIVGNIRISYDIGGLRSFDLVEFVHLCVCVRVFLRQQHEFTPLHANLWVTQIHVNNHTSTRGSHIHT